MYMVISISCLFICLFICWFKGQDQVPGFIGCIDHMIKCTRLLHGFCVLCVKLWGAFPSLLSPNLFPTCLLPIPESISASMPAELSSDGVGNGGSKLSPKTQVGTQLTCKLLWAVERVREVPFKLVYKWDVANMDIQLEGEEKYMYGCETTPLPNNVHVYTCTHNLACMDIQLLYLLPCINIHKISIYGATCTF